MSILGKIFGSAVGPLAETAVDYFKQRNEIKSRERIRKLELQEAIHQRQVDLAKQGLTADMNWEAEFAKQAAGSWKDEYTLMVVSIPAVMSFIPGAAPIVKDGFAALDATPHWYQLLTLSIFFATYGIRYWRRSQSDT